MNRLKKIRDTDAIQTFFILVAIGLATFSIAYTYIDHRRVEIEVDDNVQKEDVEFVLDRANDATQFADTVLSWLEGASVIVGVLIVVGGWMFRNSIQRQVQESQARLQESVDNSRAFVEQSRKDLEERRTLITQLEQQLREEQQRWMQDLRQDIRETVNRTEQRFSEVQNKARDNFRVLSLQLLAEQQVRAHNNKTAIKTLQTAYELAPDDSTSNYLLGYLYTSQQQIDAALDHLKRALDRDPDFAPAIAAYGLALRRQGDKLKGPEHLTERNRYWAQAEDKLLQALQMDSSLTDADNESYYGTLGGLYRRQGRYQDALETYEKAHNVTPESSYPIINLASLHKHQGNDERAGHFFELVVQKAVLTLDDDPRNVWTRADYAQARLVLGDTDGALEQLRIMIGQNPGPGVLETVRSGLEFLKEAPRKIDGLDTMIAAIDAELSKRRTQELEQLADEDGVDESGDDTPGVVKEND